MSPPSYMTHKFEFTNYLYLHFWIYPHERLYRVLNTVVNVQYCGRYHRYVEGADLGLEFDKISNKNPAQGLGTLLLEIP